MSIFLCRAVATRAAFAQHAADGTIQSEQDMFEAKALELSRQARRRSTSSNTGLKTRRIMKSFIVAPLAFLAVMTVNQALASVTPKEALTEHRVSEGLRQQLDKAGLTEDALGYSLRLYHTRGTAATRQLNNGLTLKEIAQHMGWSLCTSANMIEKYARVTPDETDAILHKLSVSQRIGTRTDV